MPINLNGAAGLPAPARVNTGNPNAGGAAYAVTVDAGNDIVVGMVQKFVPAGRGFRLMNQACVWMDTGNPPFTATLLNFAGVGGSSESVARGVSVVNGNVTVVGEVRSTDDNKWHGFIAVLNTGVWTINRVAANAFTGAWTIYGIKAINLNPAVDYQNSVQRGEQIVHLFAIFPSVWLETTPFHPLPPSNAVAGWR